MKKSIFTLVIVATAAITANAEPVEPTCVFNGKEPTCVFNSAIAMEHPENTFNEKKPTCVFNEKTTGPWDPSEEDRF